MPTTRSACPKRLMLPPTATFVMLAKPRSTTISAPLGSAEPLTSRHGPPPARGWNPTRYTGRCVWPTPTMPFTDTTGSTARTPGTLRSWARAPGGRADCAKSRSSMPFSLTTSCAPLWSRYAVDETVSQREIPSKKRTIIAATARALALISQRRRSRVRLRHAMNSAVPTRPATLLTQASPRPGCAVTSALAPGCRETGIARAVRWQSQRGVTEARLRLDRQDADHLRRIVREVQAVACADLEHVAGEPGEEPATMLDGAAAIHLGAHCDPEPSEDRMAHARLGHGHSSDGR